MSLKFKHGNENDGKLKMDVESTLDANNFECYPTPSNIRTITFTDKNDIEETLLYSDLLSVRFDPHQSEINIIFSSKSVVLRGHSLQRLLPMLTSQILKRISAVNSRYNSVNTCIVNEVIFNE